jgi:hypothetical protein
MRNVPRAALILCLWLPAQWAAAQESGLGGGVGYGGPLGAAVTGELIYGLRADVEDDGDRVRGLAGLLVQLHAGSGGGKLSLGAGGRARVDTDDFKAPAAAGVLLSVARTWGSPVGTEPGLTYLGPEIQLSAMHVGLTLGPLFRIAGGPGPAVLFSFGVGVRF